MIPQSRPDLREHDFDYVQEILRSHQVARGPFVEALEQGFCKATGVRYAVAVSSGTAALHVALSALGVQQGDEVIVPSYACVALLYSIEYVGARPVLVDIDPMTLNPPAEWVARLVNRRTKAIITTHTFGFPSAVTDLVRLGIPVIEDCAQALGARIANRPAGSYGAIAVYSLYATKVICSGEGGVVCTNSRTLANRLRDLTTPDRQAVYRLRYNYKMSDLTAGLAVRQLERLEWLVARRRSLAERYREAFANTTVTFQKALEGTEPVFYRFVIFSRKASAIIRESRARGVMCDRPVFRPLHVYLRMGRRAGLKETERVWRTAVSVPLYPALTESEVEHVMHVFVRCFNVKT